MDETDNILGKSNDSKQDDVCCSEWIVSYQNEGFSKQTLQLLDQYMLQRAKEAQQIGR